MRIHDTQLERLAQLKRSAFVDKLQSHVRALYPETVWELGAPELRQQLERRLEQAAQLGLHTESQVAYYVELSYSLGERFMKDPRFSEIAAAFHHDQLDADAKVATVRSLLDPFS